MKYIHKSSATCISLTLISAIFFSTTVHAVELNVPVQTVEITAVQIDPYTVEVFANNIQTALNASEVELFFDPLYIHIESIKINENLCNEQFIISKAIHNEIGRVFYQCGTSIPFTGTTTPLATIHVTPLQTGISPIEFGYNTNVHAYDRYGSKVMKNYKHSMYEFIN